jgi:UDP-glucose 4-epimerase
MRALITGGAGFIGSHLADLLVSKENSVVVVDNLSLGNRNNIRHLATEKNFRFIQEDLLNLDKLTNIFKINKFDTVFHLAANSDIKGSVNSPGMDLHNTFMTTWNTLECCRLFDVKQFLFASTSAVFGNTKRKLTETSGSFNPESYYGAAKLAAEAFICAYSSMNDIQAWIVRFPNVVGERATHGVVYDFIAKLKDNKKQLEILGNGKQRKPYVYVKDLVEAIFFIYQTSKAKLNCYHVGVDDQISVKEIAKIVCDEMGLFNVELLFGDGGVGWKGDVPVYRYDLSKIHALGWKARYTSREAVQLAVRRMLKK